MKQITHKPDRFRVMALAILFLLIQGGTVFCRSLPGTDSLKTKFDLNDPRNPDCPCHKYQHQADLEYAALHPEEFPGIRTTVDTSVSSTKGTLYRLYRFPSINWRPSIFLRHPRRNGRRLKTKRFHPDYSRCSRW
jgi:hypothetical protein